ncbi:tight adherence protein B [Bryocella elongata]|uniref:Tight adherence protein B n=1 Tax=Bryocella elongata TaxID=863522 RepID=A0A1H5WM68_9BACT|nr:type II secretion system F family protein [Bryocella elongata]SEG00336.1 tight adherence protein B [Bryocella elongata]
MVLVVISAVFMALLTFGIVMFVMRPSREEKKLDRRVVQVKAANPGEETASISEDLRQYLKVEEQGPFGWLEDLIDTSSLHRQLQMLILQADSTITVGNVMVASLGLGVVAALLADIFVHVLWIAIVAGFGSMFIPFSVLGFRRKRRLNKFNSVLADAIDMMARSLRAGHSLPAALGVVAAQALEPVKGEFDEVYKKQNLGLPLREAMMQMLDRVPSQDLRVFVTGVLVQKDTGGNLAEILDRIVHVIRERVRIQGEIRVHTAQGRMTGWILTGLPVVLLLLINVVDPGYSTVLFNTTIGNYLIYLGVGLLVIGGLIIRSIINGIEI